MCRGSRTGCVQGLLPISAQVRPKQGLAKNAGNYTIETQQSYTRSRSPKRTNKVERGFKKKIERQKRGNRKEMG